MNEKININPAVDSLLDFCGPWAVMCSEKSLHYYLVCNDTAYVILGDQQTMVAAMEIAKGIQNITYLVIHGVESLNLHLQDESTLVMTNSEVTDEVEDALDEFDGHVTIMTPTWVHQTHCSSSKLDAHPSGKLIKRAKLE